MAKLGVKSPEERKAEIAALPTIQSVTKLAPVKHCRGIHLVALRSGAAAGGFFDESASNAKVNECINDVRKSLRRLLKAASDLTEITPESVSPNGRIDLSAISSGQYANKKTGVLVLRVLEDCVDLVVKAMEPEFSVSPAYGGVFTHESEDIDIKFYPAAVVETIKLQAGVSSHVQVLARDGVLKIRVNIEDSNLVAKCIDQGYLAKLRFSE